MKYFILHLILLLLIPVSLQASDRVELIGRIERAEQTLKHMMRSDDRAIPEYLLQTAHAVMFLRQYKAGFVLAARGGNGIILARDQKTREWSPPAFLATAEGSLAFEGGVILSDDEANRTFYGSDDIKSRDILLEGKVGMPGEAESLIGTLLKYENISHR